MIDIPARQRDLRTIFQHTWDRLPAAACDAFMRLAVFRGGATVEAFRQVTGASMDTMAGLIDKALLRRLSSGRLEVH
jgi:hypothetical protein